MLTTVPYPFADKKRALIICNYEYQRCKPVLTNIQKKANSLRERLENMKFVVKPEMNVQSDIMSVIQNFQRNVQKNDLLFVYYAGLCCNDGETNYLLPVEADKDELDVVKVNANKVHRIIERLTSGEELTGILFVLDCAKPYANQGASNSHCRYIRTFNSICSFIF